MDFHPGGDLFTIMERKDGGMGEKKARFYIAEISECCEMKTNSFVHVYIHVHKDRFVFLL